MIRNLLVALHHRSSLNMYLLKLTRNKSRGNTESYQFSGVPPNWFYILPILPQPYPLTLFTDEISINLPVMCWFIARTLFVGLIRIDHNQRCEIPLFNTVPCVHSCLKRQQKLVTNVENNVLMVTLIPIQFVNIAWRHNSYLKPNFNHGLVIMNIGLKVKKNIWQSKCQNILDSLHASLCGIYYDKPQVKLI